MMDVTEGLNLMADLQDAVRMIDHVLDHPWMGPEARSDYLGPAADIIVHVRRAWVKHALEVVECRSEATGSTTSR